MAGRGLDDVGNGAATASLIQREDRSPTATEEAVAAMPIQPHHRLSPSTAAILSFFSAIVAPMVSIILSLAETSPALFFQCHDQSEFIQTELTPKTSARSPAE